jgi:hypothetical protein
MATSFSALLAVISFKLGERGEFICGRWGTARLHSVCGVRLTDPSAAFSGTGETKKRAGGLRRVMQGREWYIRRMLRRVMEEAWAKQ